MRDGLEFGARILVIVTSFLASGILFLAMIVTATIASFGCAICEEPPRWGWLVSVTIIVVWVALQWSVIWGARSIILKLEDVISPELR